MIDTIMANTNPEQSSHDHCTVSVQALVQAIDKVFATLIINAAALKIHLKHTSGHQLAHMCKEVANAEAV